MDLEIAWFDRYLKDEKQDNLASESGYQMWSRLCGCAVVGYRKIFGRFERAQVHLSRSISRSHSWSSLFVAEILK